MEWETVYFEAIRTTTGKLWYYANKLNFKPILRLFVGKTISNIYLDGKYSRSVTLGRDFKLTVIDL